MSIDESMVPYFGKHSTKMYIRGIKAIRFGYKLWSLCGNDGFPYQLNIYTGKDSSGQLDSRATSCVETIGCSFETFRAKVSRSVV